MANIIAQCNRPILILEPNKTLASQICTEMRGFFPDDAVEYFVIYYYYYQPEAYIPVSYTHLVCLEPYKTNKKCRPVKGRQSCAVCAALC